MWLINYDDAVQSARDNKIKSNDQRAPFVRYYHIKELNSLDVKDYSVAG